MQLKGKGQVQKGVSSTISKKPRWVAKAHLNYEYFTLSAVAESFRDEMPKVIGFPLSYKFENLDVSYDQNKLDQHVKNLLAHPSNIEEQVNFVKEQINLLVGASKKYGKKKDLKSFQRWYQVFRRFLPTFGIIFGLESALEKKLKAFLSEESFHKIAFAKETATAREQKSILRIAMIPMRSPSFEKAIEKHLKGFSWLGNKLMSRAPFTKEQITLRLDALRDSAKKRLQELRINRSNLEHEARVVLKQLRHEQRKWV